MNKIKWKKILKEEKNKIYFKKILSYLYKKRLEGVTIYPKKEDVFNVFKFTELYDIKVVILGQDPYYGFNQANGLAFSVNYDEKIPPSLLNIYKEIRNDINGKFVIPNHGYLKSWSKQGVFLLNTILTVEFGKPLSHCKLGWEIFTNKIIQYINQYCKGVIFLLWGNEASKKKLIINKKIHYILQASHPSPLSANLSFFGCKHFSKTNFLLKKQKKTPINWLIK